MIAVMFSAALRMSYDDASHHSQASVFLGVGLLIACTALPGARYMARSAENQLQEYHETLVEGVVVSVPERVQVGRYSYKIVATVEGTNGVGKPMTQPVRVPLDRAYTVKPGDTYPWE